MDSNSLRYIVENTNEPLILKNVCSWSILKWTEDNWIKNMPSKALPFRCKPITKPIVQPDWERYCPIVNMTMSEFINSTITNSNNWYYFDYKYMHQWFQKDDIIYKEILWDEFGFPNLDVSDSTLWIGSNGAHTPCHQDTYGRNIVVQVFGRKHWLLFPPEIDGLKPTRIPYEESSIYSQINFASPINLDAFNGIYGCKMVTLEPGDALIIPPKWWHFVENITPIGISINSWIPCEENDHKSRIEEALVRLFIGQICKDLPSNKSSLLLNPNEDDLPDTPLSVAILQIDTTLKKYLNYHKKKKSNKKVKLNTPKFKDDTDNTEQSLYNIDQIINTSNNIHKIKEITNEELKSYMKTKKDIVNLNELKNDLYDHKLEDETITKEIINSFCQSSIIKSVGDHLLNNIDPDFKSEI